MSFFLGNFQFEGPLDSISQIEEKEGVFAVLCKAENEISQLIHIEEGQNIKSKIRNHISSLNWTKQCDGRIVFGVYYTTDLDMQRRQMIVLEIRNTYNLS